MHDALHSKFKFNGKKIECSVCNGATVARRIYRKKEIYVHFIVHAFILYYFIHRTVVHSAGEMHFNLGISTNIKYVGMCILPRMSI